MSRFLFVTLATCLLAAPANAGWFVAVPEVNTGIEPMASATADCRIANDYNANSPCTAVFWSFGGWCLDDEVTGYFSLQNNTCLAGCAATWGAVNIESGEMGLRVVGTTCNGGYPVTTYPIDGQFSIYALDPVVSTPDCPFPAWDPVCVSVVTTVPALTATSSTDPARFYNTVCAFDWSCFPLQPVFGSYHYVAYSLPESALAACQDGGQSACAWWYPGFRGRNGTNPATPCAIPCTQYYRNVSLYGPDWHESLDAGLARQTDFAMWLNVNCTICACCGPWVGVKHTTWGKLKSVMAR
jgi:hypothetical protein